MATNTAVQRESSQKRMEYRKVSFDVNEIAPDAPEGGWMMSIPRGKCKVQPTKEDRYPMLIVPVRLDKSEEEGEEFEKAIGAELSVMIVFFGNEKARAARMSKLRLRQLCEAADVDLDIVPKEIEDPENDLEPFIKALEGKKFPGWTKHTVRKDTGETVTDVVLLDPNEPLRAGGDDEDADDEEADEEDEKKPARGAKKKTTSRKNGKGGR